MALAIAQLYLMEASNSNLDSLLGVIDLLSWDGSAPLSRPRATSSNPLEQGEATDFSIGIS